MNKLTRYEPRSIRRSPSHTSTHTHTATRRANGFNVITRHYSQRAAETEQRWQRVMYSVDVKVEARA